MTGYGQGRLRDGDDAVEVEVRSVNHRYLKVHAHLPEHLAAREAAIEECVREQVKRGTVDVDVRISCRAADAAEPFDRDLMRRYYRSLTDLQQELGIHAPLSMDALLSLPGVVRTPDTERNGAARLWPKIEKALRAALEDLDAARKREGERLRKPLKAILKEIAKLLKEVKALAPTVPPQHRDRLQERLKKLLGGGEAPVSAADLGRELALFADRCDITEEIARQESHLGEFDTVMSGAGDIGRRLDFLTQEMLREANTMGAKANDTRLTQRIVAMKSEIEKLKEQIQNIE